MHEPKASQDREANNDQQPQKPPQYPEKRAPGVHNVLHGHLLSTGGCRTVSRNFFDTRLEMRSGRCQTQPTRLALHRRDIDGLVNARSGTLKGRYVSVRARAYCPRCLALSDLSVPTTNLKPNPAILDQTTFWDSGKVMCVSGGGGGGK